MSAEIPEPYDFHWQQDAEGEFIKIKYNDSIVEARVTNTIMYLFPDQPRYDHIFIITEDCGEQWQGIHLFRKHIDALADGAFGYLCDQMFAKGFECAPDEEPASEDIEVYEGYFGKDMDTIDEIVKLAMRNIDAEIDYYQGE